jgi:hypothetical protein
LIRASAVVKRQLTLRLGGEASQAETTVWRSAMLSMREWVATVLD